MTDEPTPGTRNGWVWLDGASYDDLPAMPKAVYTALFEWLNKEYGISGLVNVGHFLDLLAEHGYVVERSVVAGARSYTTIETAVMERSAEPDPGLTEGQIKAEDPTWTPPADPERPVRSLG